MRGSGDSEGVLHGEYLKQEQDDALEILQWIAAQPWCTGAIGMIGISWGGFNGLQVAARRPPELKAVISLCSTDDRYADDIHFMGGCLLIDKFAWGSTMFAGNATAAGPRAGRREKWRDMWMERLEGSGLWIEDWHRHQRRDELYKHGSICEDYDAIQCPVFLVGGWADGYSNAIFRMLSSQGAAQRAGRPVGAQISALRQARPPHRLPAGGAALVGQVAEGHRDRHHGRADVARVDAGPVEPRPGMPSGPAAGWPRTCWPSPRIEASPAALGVNRIERPGKAPRPNGRSRSARPRPWGSPPASGAPTASAPTRRATSARRPAARWSSTPSRCGRLSRSSALRWSSSILPPTARGALVAVDLLSEVLPDGAATRLTYGILNLTHRDGHEHPQPLEPGKRYRVRVKLNDCAQRIGRGNRLRIAVSTSYWPIVWPSPQPVTLSIFTGHGAASRCRSGPRGRRTAPCGVSMPAEAAPALKPAPCGAGGVLAHRHDLEAGTRDVGAHQRRRGGASRTTSAGQPASVLSASTAITPDDPLSARRHHLAPGIRRDGFSVRILTDTRMTAAEDHFEITATLDAYEGDTRVVSKEWLCRIPRDHL
jgi:uncharacterized protein